MSFIDGAIKPKLVEQKIVDRVLKVQKENKPFKFDFTILKTTIYNFLIKHIASISIVSIITILLLYRYYDVKNKKKLLEKNNNKNSDNYSEDDDAYYSDDS